MIIDNFNYFKGQHCETTATGSLLNQLGIELSEPMLFGLGEGLGFIFWNMKTMDFPFLGGRIKPDVLTENIVRHLKLKLEAKETASIKKAWQNIKYYIDKEIEVALKLDCYHLEYFSNKFHFAGHYVAMYGYDNEFAYLIDTQQQGGCVKTSLKSLELARNEKGSMSSKNRSYTIHKTNMNYQLKTVILKAIKSNAMDYLNPPIQNIGYKGIRKTSDEIKKWFNRSKNVQKEFITAARLMEKAGTGGALFRNLYRDFLKESFDLLQLEPLKLAFVEFIDIAKMWTDVSGLLYQAGKTKDIKYVNKASNILLDIADKEKYAMELLENINIDGT
ncbi:BtrH N-terminal domain-containing protein [Bacteroidota bacterium]